MPGSVASIARIRHSLFTCVAYVQRATGTVASEKMCDTLLFYPGLGSVSVQNGSLVWSKLLISFDKFGGVIVRRFDPEAELTSTYRVDNVGSSASWSAVGNSSERCLIALRLSVEVDDLMAGLNAVPRQVGFRFAERMMPSSMQMSSL
jgi:hypothetical protein